jgi:ribosomal protein S27AE
MKIEPLKVPEGKAKELEEVCPNCGLTFPHE